MTLDEKEILTTLLTCKTSDEIKGLLERMFEEYGDRIRFFPIGNRDNNRGQIELGTDPGKSIVERITNGIDATLELEHKKHNGIPICKNPREAANSWLNVPSGGLHELSPAKRRELASNVVVTVEEGDDKSHRTIQIYDHGIGLTSKEMPSTILSLGESNKVQKLYLAGAFGQGGSSTFAYCRYSLVASKVFSQDKSQRLGFTIVYYQDLPAEQYKHGYYVYLTLDGKIFETDLSEDEFKFGTLVRHFGYDITEYRYAIGPQSIYGLLQRVLFDPIIPIMLDDKINNFRRVIKGSRNALNGAIDDADDRGPAIEYNVPLYHVSLGEFGGIGLEYWLLEENEKNREPSRSYVDSKKPILLTVNGQTHAEFSGLLIRSQNQADLPYLRNRLIVHVDCNNLNQQAKRNLFSSSREDVRKGHISKLIEEEIVKALKSDDKLGQLNEEAKNFSLRKTDTISEEMIKGEVAKVLRFHGFSTSVAVGGSIGDNGGGRIGNIPSIPKPSSHRLIKKIDVHDPPTYVKILVDSPVNFYPEQRKYIRIETDAPSNYHNSEDVTKSRFNIIINGTSVIRSGTTPLKEGRMRIILDCQGNSKVGETGEITIEISRPGMIALSDKFSYVVVAKPPPASDKKHISIPEIRFVAVEGPEDLNWSSQSWPDDITKVASSSILSNELIVYYSTVFPSFADAHKHIQKTNPTLADSFSNKYKMWLAVHSLLLEHGKKETENTESFEEWERDERCRLATMAAIIADKEIKTELQIPVKEID